MSLDINDPTPSFIRDVSDQFIVQNMLVQPGNRFTVGKNKDIYLFGVPGAYIILRLQVLTFSYQDYLLN